GVSPLTPDHVNPERPWPTVEALAATTAARGKRLRERLAIYPSYAARPDPWVAGKMRAPVSALLGPEGLGVDGQRPAPIPWQDPEVSWRPRTIALTFSKHQGAGLRADADVVYGELEAVDNDVTRAWSAARVDAARLDADVRAARAKAAEHRPITDAQARAVKDRVPGIHLHAFSPMEVLNGATKLGVSFHEFLAEAKADGLDTIPGTAAEILDDDIRWTLTKGKLPADTWEEIIRTAHGLG